MAVFDDALPVVPLQATVAAEPGRADPANATAVVEAIARAVGDVRSGVAAALVTNPISKQSLYAAGLPPSRPHRVPRHSVGGLDGRRRPGR